MEWQHTLDRIDARLLTLERLLMYLGVALCVLFGLIAVLIVMAIINH